MGEGGAILIKDKDKAEEAEILRERVQTEVNSLEVR